MKLTILGGGGFRVPLIYHALIENSGSPPVTEVALHDPNAQRVQVINSVLEQQAGTRSDAPQVVVPASLDAALEGSSIVFCALRVGGVAGRIQDERVARDLGALGQETTGPGGLAYALRTVPVIVEIAQRIRNVAPQAYVINFTNPAGLVTEAMQRVLGPTVIGICDTPSSLGDRLARALDLDPTRVRFDYAGLNHLGWMNGLVSHGRDVLPELFQRPERLANLDEAHLFGVEWLQRLGMIPAEYLYYYYCTREAIRSIAAAPDTRGEFLARQQQAFYDAALADPDAALALWTRAIRERSATYMADHRGATAPEMRSAGTPSNEAAATSRTLTGEDSGGYEQVALAVMTAISGNNRARLIVNARNGSALPELDPDAVVEVPSIVDANGAQPLATDVGELHQRGLIQQVKAVERLVIEAALTGSRETALRAFALHPLVDSLELAGALLDGYVRTIPEVAAVLEPN